VTSTRTIACAALVAVLAVANVGCGSGSGSSGSPAVPPSDAAVARAAAPLLAPFGLHVQRSSMGKKPDPRGGTELNLYVQPTRTETADEYATRMMPLAAAVIPQLYAKYPGIDWIDLCQEPAKSSGTWETVPVTRLELSRSGSGRVDWKRADLAQLLALERAHQLEISIEWHNGVGGTRVWRAAAERARSLGG
jgi:hypothetical protein